jgi:hypothetical protein
MVQYRDLIAPSVQRVIKSCLSLIVLFTLVGCSDVIEWVKNASSTREYTPIKSNGKTVFLEAIIDYKTDEPYEVTIDYLNGEIVVARWGEFTDYDIVDISPLAVSGIITAKDRRDYISNIEDAGPHQGSNSKNEYRCTTSYITIFRNRTEIWEYYVPIKLQNGKCLTPPAGLFLGGERRADIDLDRWTYDDSPREGQRVQREIFKHSQYKVLEDPREF